MDAHANSTFSGPVTSTFNAGRGGDGSVVRAPDSWTERSRVRIPAGAAGEFSSPGSTFCADSYFGIRSTPVLPQ